MGEADKTWDASETLEDIPAGTGGASMIHLTNRLLFRLKHDDAINESTTFAARNQVFSCTRSMLLPMIQMYDVVGGQLIHRRQTEEIDALQKRLQKDQKEA